MTDALRARILIASADAPPLRDQVLEIDQQRVRAIRDATDADGPADHDVLLPGLIDAHSHARGIPLSAHGIGAGPLERFLLELGARTPLDPGDEALVAAGDALGAGMTSVQVIHHTFAPADVYVRQVQAIVDSFATIGVRAFVSLALTDQGEYAPAIRGRAVDILPPTTRGVAPDEFPTLASRLLTGSIDAVGPVAPQWCSARALREIGTAARHARVHAHLLESSLQRLGPDGDDVLRLCQAGLLNERSSFAHGVWTDDQQRERLAAARSVIVHCPGSNHRLDVGRCPARRYLDSGVTLALGLDSHGAAERVDMFGEMRAALRTADELDAPIHSAEVLAMATLGEPARCAVPTSERCTPGPRRTSWLSTSPAPSSRTTPSITSFATRPATMSPEPGSQAGAPSFPPRRSSAHERGPSRRSAKMPLHALVGSRCKATIGAQST